MKVKIFSLLILIGFCLLQASAKPQLFAKERSVGNSLVDAIADMLKSLFKKGDVDFLGHPCKFDMKAEISKWHLTYKGKFWCPSWATIVGEARTKSRSGAVAGAIEDFARKAVASGLVTEKEVDIWIHNH